MGCGGKLSVLHQDVLIPTVAPPITVLKSMNARKLKEYFSTSLLALSAAFLSVY